MMAGAEAAMLLKDVQGEKNHGKIAGLWKSSSKTLCRGELILLLPRVKVIPRKDGKPAHNYQLVSDPSITLYCDDFSDLAPLSDYEYRIMVAIRSREARYEVFQKDILDWGTKLKKEIFVHATLPSKDPISYQRAVSKIKYIGPLPNEHGIWFGVEITEARYRHQGSSNGFFGGEQYFTCDENCALFVSLDRLSPVIARPHDQQKSPLDQKVHSQRVPHSHFRMNERVVVHNKQGVGIHGTVKWIEEVSYAGDKLLIVGIETDITVQSRDFVGSLPGYGQHFKCLDSRHGKLVMPEYMVISGKVDAAQQQQRRDKNLNQGTSVDPHAHAHTQFRDDKKTMQQSEEEYLKDALNVTKIDREQQIHIMREIERSRKEKQQQNTSQNRPYYVEPHNPQYHYGVIPGAADLPNRPPYQHPPSCPDERTYMYTPIYATQLHSIQDDRLLDNHSSGNIPLHHQRSMPWAGVRQGPSPVPQETVSHSFSLGSTVQLQSDPPRYGVIQWIGRLPGITEGSSIAGVKLEELMEGCSDGTWNGARYFSCHPGYGFFCPLSSLLPDKRFSQVATAAVNPLDDVPLEELHDQFINLGQIERYIGDRKGIQGHQNSCYLDSTVFGMFAVSDMFDSMFLEQQHDDPNGDEVKHLLWKGIVNPLRKYGVVRYESVMRLRDKLEELGKMKGVNQDEKDPEEFLNMLLKHTLHVPPFISIKRPFGIEDEYFVQLFVEYDESLKLPTIGDLLKRMFKDQKILFTKVPSKLLIQVPRYGRMFKTYQKTIPGIKLEVKNLLVSKYHCFMCGNSAWKKCRDCMPYFTTDATTHVYFCENCAKLTHSKRDKHTVMDVAAEPGQELELLSVICIETSHYVCFSRSENRWIFFDSYASRISKENKEYNIPKVVDCTDVLNEWVYPANGDLTRLLNSPPRELPEYVRRFTQDIYLCVYIRPDAAMYGDFEDDYEDEVENNGQEHKEFRVDHAALQQELDELKAKYAMLQQQKEEASYQIAQLQQDCTQLKVTHQEELVEKEKNEQARYQQELERHQLELTQIQTQHRHELQEMATQRLSMEQLLLQVQEKESRIKELERALKTTHSEAKEVCFTQLLSPQGADSSWNVPRNEVTIREEIGRGASGLVSKGQFRKQNVAVKQIHQFILTQKHVIDEFKREIRIMASVQHPNLVRFIGAVFDESVENLTATPLLLLELLHTNLRHAYEAQRSSFSPSVMLSIFRDMAYGLHYLHEHQEPIIHRDVSAPNVLLEALPGGTWRAKLSDFGSANFLKRSSTLGVGAIVCTAPEMFPRNDPSAPVPRPTVKCDVFSYGIVLVEVITKTMPSLENRHQLFREVEQKWRMMHDLIIQCTQLHPDDRPTVTVVLNTLNRFPVARPR